MALLTNPIVRQEFDWGTPDELMHTVSIGEQYKQYCANDEYHCNDLIL